MFVIAPIRDQAKGDLFGTILELIDSSEFLQKYAGKSDKSDENEQKEPIANVSISKVPEQIIKTDEKLSIYSSEECKEKDESIILSKSAEIHESLPPSTCYNCKNTRFWRLKSGGPWVCKRCHPSPLSDEQIEWNDKSYDKK